MEVEESKTAQKAKDGAEESKDAEDADKKEEKKDAKKELHQTTLTKLKSAAGGE